MNRLNTQLGFSLIEAMIVVSIIMILALSGIPSYQNWVRNTQIRTAAESIQSGIQKARSESIMRNTPVSFTLGANSSWSVQCVLAAQCGVIQSRSNNDGSSSKIITNPTSGSVVFNNLGIKSTTVSGQLSQVTVDYNGMASSDSRDLQINLGGGGNVRVCDPNASSSDPRKC